MRNTSDSAFRQLLNARAADAEVPVDQETRDKCETYFQLLARWNKRINLTSLPLEIPTDATVDRLFVEPLVAAIKLLPADAVSWMDLGSGGGSPAIPMKLVRPLSSLTMVESKSRKTAFLREAVRELQLENVAVLESRYEVLGNESSPVPRSLDFVTARAIRLDEILLETVSRLLKHGGRFIYFGAAPLSSPIDANSLSGPESVALTRTSEVQLFRLV